VTGILRRSASENPGRPPVDRSVPGLNRKERKGKCPAPPSGRPSPMRRSHDLRVLRYLRFPFPAFRIDPDQHSPCQRWRFARSRS
jgi:hypothetical protein